MTSGPTVPEAVPTRPEGRASDSSVMPLVDHLAELRSRIIWSVVAIAIGSAIGYVVSDTAIEVLRAPLPTKQPLVFLSIGDPFAIRLQISVVVGVILAMPVILFNLWRFVAPGLTASERRAVRPWIPAALAFFAIGVAIAYIILPFAAQFLLGFQTADLVPLLSAREYFGFVTTLFLAFGILMEFPILLVGLSRGGDLTSERPRRPRRYVILGISIFSAVATPGTDPVSPVVLGVTMYVLFEATLIFIRRSGH
jgi:sec-independent protein translocase protein TatC